MPLWAWSTSTTTPLKNNFYLNKGAVIRSSSSGYEKGDVTSSNFGHEIAESESDFPTYSGSHGHGTALVLNIERGKKIAELGIFEVREIILVLISLFYVRRTIYIQ